MQRECGNAVARRCGLVGERLGAVDELLVVVGREIEAAVVGVLEMPEQEVGDFHCESQVLCIPSRLQQLEQRIQEKRVVVEVGAETCMAVLVTGQQASVDDEPVAKETGCRGGRIHEVLAVEDTPRDREAANRERIPRGELLVVEAGRDALPACGQQRVERRPDPRFRVLDVLAHREVPAAFEVGFPVEPEAARDEVEGFPVEQGADFVGRPDVVLAFFALGVRVPGRVESAVRRQHVAQHPVRGAVGRLPEQRLARRLGRQRIRGQQGAVVVEHLFEVRYLPVAVDRVAAETAADVIEDAAMGHARQGQRGHEQRIDVGFVVAGGAAPGTEKPLQCRRMGKLGSMTAATEIVVEAVGQAPAQLAHGPRVQGVIIGRAIGYQFPKYVDEAFALVAYRVTVLDVVARDLAQQVAERGQPVARLVGKIGAAEKRPLVRGGEEHGQRPAAAALREQLVRGLVDPVDVGPLLAVDLDVDEQFVHERGRGLVLERLVRHHVTPVAGGVADREQHGPRGLARQRKRLLSPRVPVDGIVGVLQQVGTGFSGKSVGHGLL